MASDGRLFDPDGLQSFGIRRWPSLPGCVIPTLRAVALDRARERTIATLRYWASEDNQETHEVIFRIFRSDSKRYGINLCLGHGQGITPNQPPKAVAPLQVHLNAGKLANYVSNIS